MSIRLSILCLVLLSLIIFVGCPQSPAPKIPVQHQELGIPAEQEPVAEPGPQVPTLPQETPEEIAVRERVKQLGGTCRKNPVGKIIGIVIENNELTVDDMWLIAKLIDLESIRITGPSVNDKYVEAMSGLTRLKSVDIENSNITDKSLEILKALPDIDTLSLRRNLGFTDHAVALFAEFPKLHTLKILYNGFSPTSLFGLKNLTAVRVLDLRGLQVGNDTLMFIAKLENLEEIHIRSGSVANTGVAQLKKCKKLKILELQDTDVSAGCAEHFKEMESLRFLRIFRCPQFGAEAIAELGILTNLDTLELRDMNCNNESLQALKPLVGLKTVEFSELKGVDAATIIDVLKAYPKLENIRMFAMPVDDAVAGFLATMVDLKSIGVPATRITDNGLDALTAIKDLTSLDIHGNKERITLQGANVLGKFKNLRRLILPESLDDPVLKSAILKSSPRCVITIKTYSQEG